MVSQWPPQSSLWDAIFGDTFRLFCPDHPSKGILESKEFVGLWPPIHLLMISRNFFAKRFWDWKHQWSVRGLFWKKANVFQKMAREESLQTSESLIDNLLNISPITNTIIIVWRKNIFWVFIFQFWNPGMKIPWGATPIGKFKISDLKSASRQ